MCIGPCSDDSDNVDSYSLCIVKLGQLYTRGLFLTQVDNLYIIQLCK